MKLALATLLIASTTSLARSAQTDKTLVAWVTLANKKVTAGSLLTIQRGPQFDGIVYAERSAGKWMAGSDLFVRTLKDQTAVPLETADRNTLIQIAIVYQDDRITLYRNGQPYSSHEATNVDLLRHDDNIVVFGLRHVGGNGSIAGAIDDARIYARALTTDELKSLNPDKASAIEPYAWWDFEGDKAVDRAGRFPHSLLGGNAKLADGKLVLAEHAVLIAARSQAAAVALVEEAKQKFPRPYEPHTPALPSPIPETWLTYHLAHPGPDKAIPGDPNCAIYHKGRYHLFYIYQSFGHSFAHVSSTDMVHWKWHTTTLTPPKTGHGMFSGTAFRTKDDKVAIIYHGQGSGRNQIAFALDDNLDKWSKPIPVEPKTAAGEPPEMRHWDPDCWLRDGTYYSIAGGANPTLSKSSDLKSWQYVGELLHPDFGDELGVKRGEDISCANMFPLGKKWMLLCISHGLGCRYYLGDFKDDRYLPAQHAMLNWARWDFFAPESLLTPDGRRVMWAWCTPWVNNMQHAGRKQEFEALMNFKIQPGVQALPRELSLTDEGTLRIKPLRELEDLRTDKQQETAITVKNDSSHLLEGIAGDTLELEIVFENPMAREFGVNVLCDADGNNGFTIASGQGSKTLTVGYVNPPFELKEREDLRLRIFIDKSMIEVFANDRQAAVAWHESDPEDLRVRLFSEGGDTNVARVTAWKMKSIYDGKTGAE